MIKKIFSKNGKYYWFTSPWVVSFIFTFLYVLIYPEFFNKYKIDYRIRLSDENELATYADMDGDGRDDVLKVIKLRYKKGYGFKALKKTNTLYKTPIFKVYPFIDDCNNDNFKETFFISKSQDSLFLTIGDYKNNVIRNKFVEKIKGNFVYDYIGFIDSNNDGSKEFYFWLCSKRYSNQRYIYRYDFKTHSIKKSEGIDARYTCSYICNVEGEDKIVIATSSYRTIGASKMNFDEKLAWIFILDKDLKFAAKPICLKKPNTFLISMNIKVNGKDRICVVGDGNRRVGKDKDVSFVNIYDYSGRKIDEKIIPYDLLIERKGYFSLIKDNNSEIYLTARSGGLLKYSSDLRFLGRLSPGGLARPIAGVIADLDKDGQKEIFFHDNQREKILIIKDDFSNPVLFERPEPLTKYLGCRAVSNVYENILCVSVHPIFAYNNFFNENIIIEYRGLTYFIRYGVDKKLWLKYIYVLCFFIIIFLVVWALRYFVTKSVEEKYAIENTIAQLKFQNVRNQMSPHFTLNAMNSIASLVYKEDRDKAYDFLCKLAKLVRNSLIDANRLERSLKEELDFVESYLDIQKFRFRNKFDFQINVDNPKAYNVKVMPFLVQTFVENSMKHGLKDLGSGGLISVNVSTLPSGIVINVIDNGQGRKAAAKKKTQSTGKGIKLVKEYMNIINKIDDRKMAVYIIDLEENNIALGTRVEIFIDKVW